MSRPKIFVSVANYRDPETPKTIEDMFRKAKYPGRVFAGVFSQIDRVQDKHCTAPAFPNVRQAFAHYSESRGCCWARAYIQSDLMRDEDFFFQIDSHTRFVQDWDEKIIEEWTACGDPRAYITHYPPGYQLDGTYAELSYIRHKVKGFMFNGIPTLTSIVSPLSSIPPKPARTPWLAGGCFFTAGYTVREVPYDPFIYFEGEESSLAYRLFSKGYNGYTIRTPVIYHLYYAAANGRARHFEQNPDYTKLNETSFARVRHMLGIAECKNPRYLLEYAKYGPGTLRSLQQYEHFAGVYFKEQRIASKAEVGVYG